MRNSTRRFLALPDDVALDATGLDSPAPFVRILIPLTPREFNTPATDLAREIDKFLLYDADPSESV